ncbi:uncharacterized protein [Antedon mediterranea]|uniref:uncharacterized protein n=1 Tax=Antedon mediterranea TaxID=105859 RepID=UPI003AF7AC32
MDTRNADIPLSISVSTIEAHLDCPVCMCHFTKACLTACGHRFCEKCIRGCIDNRHKCPCCNARLHHFQITLDPLFDSLLSSVKIESKLAEQQHFSDLIKAAHEQENKNLHREKTPVEMVLQKHLSKSLAQHELFYKNVKMGLEQHIATAEADKQSSLQQLQTMGSLTDEEVAIRVAEIEEGFETLKEALGNELKTSTQLIIDAYDRFLSTSLPDPSVLPVAVPVRFLKKDLKLRNQILQPMTSVSDIKTEVIKEVTGMGERVFSFPADTVKFVLLRPFTKYNSKITDDMLISIANQTTAHPDVIVMSLECRPLIEIDAQAGCEIVIIGPVTLCSEVPKQCYAKMFNKAEPSATNYYTCIQCNYSWICEVCKESCHIGHSLNPKIVNYTPTWACCYCLKKKTCIHKDRK